MSFLGMPCLCKKPPTVQIVMQHFIQAGRMADAIAKYWLSIMVLSFIAEYWHSIMVLSFISSSAYLNEYIVVHCTMTKSKCFYFFTPSYLSPKLLLVHLRLYLFPIQQVTADWELLPQWSLWEMLMWFMPLPLLQLCKAACLCWMNLRAVCLWEPILYVVMKSNGKMKLEWVLMQCIRHLWNWVYSCRLECIIPSDWLIYSFLRTL